MERFDLIIEHVPECIMKLYPIILAIELLVLRLVLMMLMVMIVIVVVTVVVMILLVIVLAVNHLVDSWVLVVVGAIAGGH